MPLFITSTGTGQGKTYVTRLLCKQLQNAYAIKPVISGYGEDEVSDTELIIEAMGRNFSVNECSPWRFKQPLSPDLAAKIEGREIIYSELLDFCARDEVDIIEGAGGVMSPITSKQTNIDLIADTGSSAILVSSMYLGCISHILTALEVIKQRNIEVAGLILCPVSADDMDAETVLASLTPQLQVEIKVFVLKFIENFAKDWKKQIDLTSLVLEK